MAKATLHYWFYHHYPIWQYPQGRWPASQEWEEKRRHEGIYGYALSSRRSDGGAAHISRQTRPLPAQRGAPAQGQHPGYGQSLYRLCPVSTADRGGDVMWPRWRKTSHTRCYPPQRMWRRLVLSPTRTRVSCSRKETWSMCHAEWNYGAITQKNLLCCWPTTLNLTCGTQNFPLHFFYGDNVCAIQIQIWVVLIANLLCTIVQRMIKRHMSFSQVVTMIRLTLMYYTNFVSFIENPDNDEKKIWAEKEKSPMVQMILFE